MHTSPMITNEAAEFLGVADMSDVALLLRTTSSAGKAYGGFQWPTEPDRGVEAPDWDSTPECGGGLHGALWGEGDGTHLARSGNWDGLWSVVAVRASTLVDLGGKVKAPRAWVVHVGDRASATAYVYTWRPGAAVIGSTLTGGDGSTLTGGYGSTLTGGYGSTLTGGDRSTLTGGDGSAHV